MPQVGAAATCMVAACVRMPQVGAAATCIVAACVRMPQVGAAAQPAGALAGARRLERPEGCVEYRGRLMHARPQPWEVRAAPAGPVPPRINISHETSIPCRAGPPANTIYVRISSLSRCAGYPAAAPPAVMCSRLSGETRYRVPTPTRPSPTPTSITLRCSCKGRTSGVRLSACQRGEQAESHQSRVSNSP